MSTFGNRVRLVRKSSGTTILRNVTEIHYMHNPSMPSVAFESDVHGTGINERLSDIVEFEATAETYKSAGFYVESADVVDINPQMAELCAPQEPQ